MYAVQSIVQEGLCKGDTRQAAIKDASARGNMPRANKFPFVECPGTHVGTNSHTKQPRVEALLQGKWDEDCDGYAVKKGRYIS